MAHRPLLSRREFIRTLTATGALVVAGRWAGGDPASAGEDRSAVYLVEDCPVHDGRLRHCGIDALFDLLAATGLRLYRSESEHPWAGPAGIVARDDVVLIKVNCQWKCRGTTNTDVLQGLIYRMLQHPDGFSGEVVIFENGQGQGSFDGRPHAWGSYSAWPEIDNGIHVNAEKETLLTVDYLVNTIFKNDPVSACLLDPIRGTFISGSDHTTDGYRRVADVSYPCFTSAGGHRIELREGLWNGSGFDGNLKLINLPVLKTHGGTGITGALKHCYGILSMADGYTDIRHYSQAGVQCGKMISLVRAPDLNILDCIWVSPKSLSGYPPSATYRADTLLAGTDPVALDYFAAKHVLLPLGGSPAGEHDPDRFAGLRDHLRGASDFINLNGGINGQMTATGDDRIELFSASAAMPADTPGSSAGGGGGCFIGTAAGSL
ncbi:MAG: DUF362 domain-containing protein [Desulfobacterales bacterium]|jgi:hypothetical protein|nr:DUF362 domain-containing protein [Desulfobacterales bacterium]